MLPRVPTLAATLALASPGLCDEPRTQPELSRDTVQGPAAHVSFEAFGQHSFKSKLSDDNGKVSVTTAGATLGLRFPAAERSQLALGFDTEYRWYGFTDAFKFAPPGGKTPGKPWDSTEQLAATAVFSHQFDDRWAGFIGGGVDSSREVGADFGDSLTYGGIVGATYQVSDTLKLGASVTVRSRLEDSLLVIPVPIIDWKFAENWTLTTDRKVHRAGINLSYAASQQWSFTLSAGVQSGEFRLVDDGAQPDGVGRDWRVPVVLEAAWQATPHVTVSAFLGAEVWGQVTLDNSNGDRVLRSDLDPTILAGGAVTLRW